MKRTALDVYTSPNPTPLESLALFVAQTAYQRNQAIRQPRPDDVWAILVVLEHHDALKELRSYSRTALGNFVGLVCQIWAMKAQD